MGSLPERREIVHLAKPGDKVGPLAQKELQKKKEEAAKKDGVSDEKNEDVKKPSLKGLMGKTQVKPDEGEGNG